MSDDGRPRCLLCHLDWEEREIFPFLVAQGFGELVLRLEREHAQFRAALAAGAAPNPAALALHAIDEERALGELVEAARTSPLFAELVAPWHELRRDHVAIEVKHG